LIATQFSENEMNHDHSQHDSEPKGFWNSRYAIGLIVLGAVAVYFLVSEHRAHFFSALPFLLLLICPAMHIFMHGSHGSHGGHGGHGHQHGGSQESGKSATTQSNKSGEQS
jgi:hypothetical protein